MDFECRIKQNRAISQMQYKGKTITKDWKKVNEDYSVTNTLIECRLVKKKLTEPKKSRKDKLLEEAEKLGLDRNEMSEMNEKEIKSEIDMNLELQ